MASTSASARARSSASSARTGPARRRPCGCSRRSSRPTSGEATVAGADLRREPQQVRERIGYVPQGGSTDPAETGRGELVLQGRLYGMNKSDAQARAAEVLAALDLEAAADRTTSTYSGGMKRRLDVGLGIVHKPSVLFLDEPTTGLDPQARARMWDEIRLLRAGGTTVFLTTHYLEEADALADRLAIIDHGVDRRRRHGRRPEAPGGRRRRDARRQRRDRARPRSRPAPAVRARGDQRGRRRPALRRPWRDGRAAAPPRPRRGRAGGVLDRPPPPEPRRRLPPPDRSLAARRGAA